MVTVIHVARAPATRAGFLFHWFSRNWRNIDDAVSVTTIFFCYDFSCFQVLYWIAFVICNDGIDEHHRLDTVKISSHGVLDFPVCHAFIDHHMAAAFPLKFRLGRLFQSPLLPG